VHPATINVYKESLHEVQEEREKLHETAVEGRRTIEIIARRVTALYFKLKCHELDQDKLSSSKNSLPPQLQTDRKLTTVGGGQVSERNILNLMELIETRSIQIVDAYLKQLTAKRSRRPSLILVSIDSLVPTNPLAYLITRCSTTHPLLVSVNV